jgi:hypothetical protein
VVESSDDRASWTEIGQCQNNSDINHQLIFGPEFREPIAQNPRQCPPLRVKKKVNICFGYEEMGKMIGQAPGGQICSNDRVFEADHGVSEIRRARGQDNS